MARRLHNPPPPPGGSFQTSPLPRETEYIRDVPPRYTPPVRHNGRKVIVVVVIIILLFFIFRNNNNQTQSFSTQDIPSTSKPSSVSTTTRSNNNTTVTRSNNSSMSRSNNNSSVFEPNDVNLFYCTLHEEYFGYKEREKHYNCTNAIKKPSVKYCWECHEHYGPDRILYHFGHSDGPAPSAKQYFKKFYCSSCGFEHFSTESL
jgi:hypothetical protein